MTNNFERYRAARDLLQANRTDLAKTHETFTWPTFDETFNWAHDWFSQIAQDNSREALRIVEEDGSTQSLTYDEIDKRSNQVANWLAELGVSQGTGVMVMLGNQIELWETMLAVFKLGAVALPTTTAMGADDLPERIERGGAKFVVANAADSAKFAGLLDQVKGVVIGGPVDGWADFADNHQASDTPLPHPQTAPDDLALLYFTSGTTSRPKLVAHTQTSYPVGHLSTSYWLGVQTGDVHWNISSPGWGKHVWSCFFVPWIAEATIFVYNYQRFDAPAILEQLRTQGISSFCAPPTVWRMLIKQDLGSVPAALREVIAAGEPLNPEVISQVERAWGLQMRDGFGQTETTAQVGNSPGNPIKPGSMGRPLPGMPVVLVDPVSGELTSDEGEICLDLSVPFPGLMREYLGDEQKTSNATAGGFYHTGDIASRDSDGYLFYVGRSDDVFKSSDYKLSPFEIESALIEHPAVAEAAVVPAPDPLRLSVPKAYVSLTPGWEPNAETAESILRHARNALPPYMRVRRLEFFDLPKTISGKIRRVELRGRENDDPEAVAQGEYRDDQFPALKG